MATVLVRMRTTAAGPELGTLHEGKVYRIDATQAREWAQVHPGTGKPVCEVIGEPEDDERIIEPERETLDTEGENVPAIPKVVKRAASKPETTKI
jgi:hypothetical protein